MTTPQSNLMQSMTQHLASDGLPAKVFQLKNANGVVATFMDLGATWLSCQVPVKGEMREVLLGTDTLEKVQQSHGFLGVTVGRYANRINNGQFEIDGESYQVPVNTSGHALHGGKEGFDKRRWVVESASEQKVVFSLVSQDGDQGFPGQLMVLLTYELTDNNQVEIHYRAKTDKPTLVNLTNHAYFNLMGAESGEDCLSHILSINAEQYLPIADDGIPLGELDSVQETSFDFRSPKLVAQDWLSEQQQVQVSGYDHSFLLNRDCLTGECAATVTSPDSLLTMKLFTTKPAVQLYTGNFVAGNPNRSGGKYENHSGLALETQYLPDSPNHPQWPQGDIVLRPDEEYFHSTIYQFVVNV